MAFFDNSAMDFSGIIGGITRDDDGYRFLCTTKVDCLMAEQ